MSNDDIKTVAGFANLVKSVLKQHGIKHEGIDQGIGDVVDVLERNRNPDTVEREARRIDVQAATTKGTHCRACGSNCKYYARSITQPMLADLWRLYQRTIVSTHHDTTQSGYLHRGHFLEATAAGGDFAKFINWRFVIEEANSDEAKKRSGWWKITQEGIKFLTDPNYRVYKTVYLYMGNFKRFKTDSPMVNAQEASDFYFNYTEMMNEPININQAG